MSRRTYFRRLRTEVFFASLILGVIAGPHLFRLAQHGWDLYELGQVQEQAANAGLPSKVEDLDAARPIPDSQNAAFLIREAAEMFRSRRTTGAASQSLNQFRKSLFDGTPIKAPSLAIAVRLNEPAASRVIAASKLPSCSFDRDWTLNSKLTFPELAGLQRNLAAILASAWLQVESGNRNEARETMLVVARVARLIRQEPSPVAAMISMTAERQTLTLLMLIQKKHPTNRFWLNATDEIIAAFGPPIDIRHSMKSIWYTFVRPERLSDDDLAFYFNAPPGSRQPGLRPSLKLRLEIELVRSGIQLYEAWPRDPLNYLAIAEASRLATRRVNSVAERARISTTPSPTPFHYGEGTAATLALSAGEALARRRVARVFARALLWKLDNGRFPAKLPVDGADALDPLTGKPLSYYGGELTFTVSAVGRDLVPSASSRADIVASYP